MTQIKPELIRIAARQVRVWQGGAGQNLILLHGGLGDARWHWHPVWDALAATFRVAAPDLPRFGGTVELPELSWIELIEWLARVQTLIGMSDAVVVGNSFGGALARFYAAAEPARVTRLILADGGHIHALPKWARRATRAPFAALLFEWLRRRTFSEQNIRRAFAEPARVTPEMIRASQDASRGFIALLRQTLASDLPAQKNPSQPTQLIWGEHDKLAPRARAHEIAADLPNARLALVKNAGHLPQLEDPLSFAQITRAFCAL